MSEFCATPATPKQTSYHDCTTCSVCWSPLSRLEGRELFGGQNGEISSDSGVSEDKSGENSGENSEENSGEKSREVITTKCGHRFHEACLMQVKVRKAECPYCRAPLTPILNPGVVAAAMESESLPSTTRRDAIIHASIRARNAVLRANNARRENAAAPVIQAQAVA